MDEYRLRAALQRYRLAWPGEDETVGNFETLLAEHQSRLADAFVRERLAGHFTASAWLVDTQGRRTLLTHHRKLGRWLQLGGHADGDQDLRRVALREAEEESGLAGLSVEDEPFDLDRHRILEHKGVPAHWHYDVRYVVRAGSSEAFVVSEESNDLAWRDIAEVAADETLDPSLRRMARKWLAQFDRHR